MIAVDPVRTASRVSPGAAALCDDRRSLTYAELDEAISRRARQLAARGVAPGDRVVLQSAVTLEAVIVLHAVARRGAVLAPLHPDLTAREIDTALAVLQPTLVIAEGVGDETDLADLGRGPEKPFDPPARAAADDHSIIWTSGSSGTPRGVRLSWASHSASAAGVVARLDLAPDDVWYAALSLAHVGGLALLYRAAFCGAQVYAPGRFDAAHLARLVDAGTVTHAPLVPTMFDLLHETRARPAPDSLRTVLLGGAPARPQLIETALDARYPLALTYGLTEACSQVATAPPALIGRKPGTVGPPLDGVEVRCAPDGEILVRGETVMAGYVNADTTVRNGWLHSGDLGRFDEDGHLWVTGRKTDRIVSGGVNVDPAEVEAVLGRCPSVRDVAVVGVDDDRWGEIVAALVVPVGGADLTIDEVMAFARQHLAPAKRPKYCVITRQLPVTERGKVDRRAVRERVQRERNPTIR